MTEVSVVKCVSLTDDPVAIGMRPREYPPRPDQRSGLYHNETRFALPFVSPDAGLPADPPFHALNDVRAARLYRPAGQAVVVGRGVRNRLPHQAGGCFRPGRSGHPCAPRTPSLKDARRGRG